MKLTLDKLKLGYTSVYGAQMLYVAKAHAVPLKEGGWVYCEEGDVCIEVRAQRNKALLGYSYLSGPAIGTIRYVDEEGSVYYDKKEVRRRGLQLPEPKEGEHSESWFNRVVTIITEAKFNPSVDVWTVALRTESADTVPKLGDILRRASMYAPRDDIDRAWGCHIFGLVRCKRGGPVAALHVQPKKHASPASATPFQIAMVVESNVIRS